ncbi:transcription factor GAGA-like isoform X2 [Pseudomyrmex gracilis]|uniref:transcription factor GAGA-like isoform X2 n=1 Tax=Pseudomyrmex gracilis TaxID=219809 RepID=UPI0009951E6B|nr:transcription factor GAGA-like isoform X2 [Pseudomyrmex gracilis]
MEDDQQFCLRWNNHQSTLIQNFDTLLESGTLVDCTLAAEGKTLKAHKVVLSACSPYFECLLSEHYDKHPVFILKDVKFKELKAMMDYMYRGEVNISQDQLAALLKAAESLQIKGLSESKTTGSSKTESRPQKPVSQPTAPSLDIPHSSSGLTIEKNKVPRQSMTSSSVGDIPEDTASPQAKGLSSKREGSQSPTPRKRKRIRRRSSGEENTIENQDASSSSDMPQQMSVPALGIAPVADEKVHSNPTDSLGRSTLMTQLTKPADEMLQLPLEKPEPNDNFIEPKSEFVEETEEGVEDLTLDDDMNDLNDMEQDNNRAGPSHDSTQHSGLGTWHVTGNRSNAEGIYEAVGGGSGPQDEVYLAQEAAQQAHRDSQEKEEEEGEETPEIETPGISEIVISESRENSIEKEISLKKTKKLSVKRKKSPQMESTLVVEKVLQNDVEIQLIIEKVQRPVKKTSASKEEILSEEEPLIVKEKEKLSKKKTNTSEQAVQTREKTTVSSDDASNNEPSTSTGHRGTSRNLTDPDVVISLNGSSDNESTAWTAKNDNPTYLCSYCNELFFSYRILKRHVSETCLSNPNSRTNNLSAGRYKCHDCGRNYKHEKNLRYHQKHECKQTVTCPDCGRTMQGTYITERHKRNYCVSKQWRKKETKLEPLELFSEDSSMEL